MKNIWILSRDFPPKSNIAAKRFAGLGPQLESRGWRPWILTVKESIYGSPPGELLSPLPAEQVLRFAPVETDDRVKFVRDLDYYFRFALGAPGHTRYWTVQSSLHFIDDYGQCQAVGLIELARSRGFPAPDLVLSSVPPGGAILLGAKIASYFGGKWVVDFRDLQALRDNRPWPVCLLDRLIERFLLRKADGFVGVSPTIAEILQRAYNRPTTCVFNGYQSQEAKSTNAPAPESNYLYYAGTIYSHQIASVLTLLGGLAGLPQKERRKHRVLLRFLPGPAEECHRKIESTVYELGLQEVVSLAEPVTHEVYRSEASQSATNLVFEDLSQKTLYSRGTLTGKLMELLPLAPPVLAIARPDSDIKQVLQQSGCGELVSTPSEVAEFLTREAHLRNRPKNLVPFARPEQATRLTDFLDSLME